MNRKYCFTLILGFLIISLPNLTIYAHSGRTDSSGCHTNHSTGNYHCHNGTSSNSNSNSTSIFDSSETNSTYNNEVEELYKDNDFNGINDYSQEWEELAENIKEIGKWDGYNQKDIENPYSQTLSNAEYGHYKVGYTEGLRKIEMSKKNSQAYDEGYKSGQITDEIQIPPKYQSVDSTLESYKRGFLKAQTKKWNDIAKEKANKLVPLALPEDLPAEVKKQSSKLHSEIVEDLKKEAFNNGYTSAFINNKIHIPLKVSDKVLIEQYEKGFVDNKEIIRYKDEAYQLGVQGSNLIIPNYVQKNKANELYRMYYERGKEERLNNIKNNIIKWLIIIAILFFSAILFRRVFLRAKKL